MRHFIKVLFVATIGLGGVVGLGTISGCGSTQVLSVWRAPTLSEVKFSRVLVFAPSKDQAMRREAEDELVRWIPNAQAVPSYTINFDAETGNDEAIRAKAKAAGFDGAVVMRVLSVRREATWVPGTWSGPIYAYGGWPAYDPGHIEIDTYARVETNIYSLGDDQLIWASASQTVNPSSARSLAKHTAKSVAHEMKKQHLVQE